MAAVIGLWPASRGLRCRQRRIAGSTHHFLRGEGDFFVIVMDGVFAIFFASIGM